MIQRNAIRSWKQLDDCQVLLCGNTPDIDHAAMELGVDHADGIACNSYGTPLLSSAFARAGEVARNDVLCYANADLILLQDFLDAVKTVSTLQQRFLIVGECWNVVVDEELSTDTFANEELESAFRGRVSATGVAPRAGVDRLLRIQGRNHRSDARVRSGAARLGQLDDLACPFVWDTGSRHFAVDRSPAPGSRFLPCTRPARSTRKGHEGDMTRRLLDVRQGLFSLQFATHRLVDSELVPHRGGGIVHVCTSTCSFAPWRRPSEYRDELWGHVRVHAQAKTVISKASGLNRGRLRRILNEAPPSAAARAADRASSAGSSPSRLGWVSDCSAIPHACAARFAGPRG